MTDFRPVRRLLAYSGGTVPDSDRIHYSPPVLKAKLAALEQYMKLHVLYTRKTGLSMFLHIENHSPGERFKKAYGNA